jgi:hypothetical protein
VKELVRTNDQVLISWLVALLEGEGITAFVLDAHTSILEGTAGAIPRRLMVADDDHERACTVIEAAGAGKELRAPR